MKSLRLIAALTVATMVSACATPQLTSRNAPFEPVPDAQVDLEVPQDMRALSATVDDSDIPQRPALQTRYRVVNYAVTVPEELKVSEANLYYPIADVVWRGDPMGDRKEQVGRIFQASLEAARDGMSEGRPVKAEIVVNRFHSVTEKTRYSVGGVHSISFFVTLRDAATGEKLEGPYKVKSDLEAFGGRRAIHADRQGHTMKARVTAHLKRVLMSEFANPGSWNENDKRIARAADQI